MDVGNGNAVLSLEIFIHLKRWQKKSRYCKKAIKNRVICKKNMTTTKSKLKSDRGRCYKELSQTMMILLFNLPPPIVLYFGFITQKTRLPESRLR